MPYSPVYKSIEPDRAELNQSTGWILLEFGADWCGHCRAIDSSLEDVLTAHPEVQHLRIADGRGKPLGRSFRVKLWPTLILLHEGQVVGELVRPGDREIRQLLDQANS